MIKSQGVCGDNEKGFTLTELMVTAAISTTIIAAGFSALTITQKTTQASNQVSSTQSTARTALDMLAADIKLAGFGMREIQGGPVGNCHINQVPAAIVPSNAILPNVGPDSVSLVVPMTNSIAAGGPLWQVSAGGPGLIGGTGPGVSIVSIPLPAGATAAMGNAIPGGVPALVNMSVSINGAAGSRIVGTTPTQINVNPAITGAQFGNGAQVYLLQCITYQIIPPPDGLGLCQGNAPCLVRGVAPGIPLPGQPPNCNNPNPNPLLPHPCVPILDGVEDLQLAYACDGCDPRVNSGIADGQLDDLDLSNGFNQADFITQRNWFQVPPPFPFGIFMTPEKIRMVQISIVARETKTEQGMGEGNQVITNNSPVLTVSDHNHANGVFALGDNTAPAQLQAYMQFRRRILTRTVELRNQR